MLDSKDDKSQICARICPSGAMEVRTRGLEEMDESYQHADLEIYDQ